MSPCEQWVRRLIAAANGEAAPVDALALGKHVADCTACRIRLARERRLVEIVEGLLDPIDVDETFLDRLMSRLPRDGHRARGDSGARRRRDRRGLRLAAWITAVLGSAAGAGIASVSTPTGWIASRLWEIDPSIGWTASGVDWAHAATATFFQGVRSGVELGSLPYLASPTAVAQLCASISVGALLLAAAFTVAAAWSARTSAFNRVDGAVSRR